MAEKRYGRYACKPGYYDQAGFHEYNQSSSVPHGVSLGCVFFALLVLAVFVWAFVLPTLMH